MTPSRAPATTTSATTAPAKTTHASNNSSSNNKRQKQLVVLSEQQEFKPHRAVKTQWRVHGRTEETDLAHRQNPSSSFSAGIACAPTQLECLATLAAVLPFFSQGIATRAANWALVASPHHLLLPLAITWAIRRSGRRQTGVVPSQRCAGLVPLYCQSERWIVRLQWFPVTMCCDFSTRFACDRTVTFVKKSGMSMVLVFV